MLQKSLSVLPLLTLCLVSCSDCDDASIRNDAWAAHVDGGSDDASQADGSAVDGETADHKQQDGLQADISVDAAHADLLSTDNNNDAGIPFDAHVVNDVDVREDDSGSLDISQVDVALGDSSLPASLEDPCAEIDCDGHGRCVADGDLATCQCDFGYAGRAARCLRCESVSTSHSIDIPLVRSTGTVDVVGDPDWFRWLQLAAPDNPWFSMGQQFYSSAENGFAFWVVPGPYAVIVEGNIRNLSNTDTRLSTQRFGHAPVTILVKVIQMRMTTTFNGGAALLPTDLMSFNHNSRGMNWLGRADGELLTRHLLWGHYTLYQTSGSNMGYDLWETVFDDLLLVEDAELNLDLQQQRLSVTVEPVRHFGEYTPDLTFERLDGKAGTSVQLDADSGPVTTTVVPGRYRVLYNNHTPNGAPQHYAYPLLDDVLINSDVDTLQVSLEPVQQLSVHINTALPAADASFGNAFFLTSVGPESISRTTINTPDSQNPYVINVFPGVYDAYVGGSYFGEHVDNSWVRLATAIDPSQQSQVSLYLDNAEVTYSVLIDGVPADGWHDLTVRYRNPGVVGEARRHFWDDEVPYVGRLAKGTYTEGDIVLTGVPFGMAQLPPLQVSGSMTVDINLSSVTPELHFTVNGAAPSASELSELPSVYIASAASQSVKNMGQLDDNPKHPVLLPGRYIVMVAAGSYGPVIDAPVACIDVGP